MRSVRLLGFFVFLCVFLPAAGQAATEPQKICYREPLVCKPIRGVLTCPDPATIVSCVSSSTPFVQKCPDPKTHLAYSAADGRKMCLTDAETPVVPGSALEPEKICFKAPLTCSEKEYTLQCPVSGTHLAYSQQYGRLMCLRNARMLNDDEILAGGAWEDDDDHWHCPQSNRHPVNGPKGWKCVLNAPQRCPGLPAHKMVPYPGYDTAYQCVLLNPDKPTCSSTETLKEMNPGEFICSQNYTSPPPQCKPDEGLVTDGGNPPKYGCRLGGSKCKPGESLQGTPPVCTSKTTMAPPTCPTGQHLNVDTRGKNPVYSCVANAGSTPLNCPAGQSPILVPAKPPATPTYVCRAKPEPTCPAGQHPRITSDNPFAYVCDRNNQPNNPTDCPDGQSKQLVGKDYVCKENPTTTCPPGQHPKIISDNPFAYICVANNVPTCPPGQSLQQGACQDMVKCPAGTTPKVTSVTPLVYSCEALPTSCPSGQTMQPVGSGYACVADPVFSCPTGKHPKITGFSPITYDCVPNNQ